MTDTLTLMKHVRAALAQYGAQVARITTDRTALLTAARDVMVCQDIRGNDTTWECRWCGREYDIDAAVLGYCTSEDCPGHALRAAIADAEATPQSTAITYPLTEEQLHEHGYALVQNIIQTPLNEPLRWCVICNATREVWDNAGKGYPSQAEALRVMEAEYVCTECGRVSGDCRECPYCLRPVCPDCMDKECPDSPFAADAQGIPVKETQ